MRHSLRLGRPDARRLLVIIKAPAHRDARIGLGWKQAQAKQTLLGRMVDVRPSVAPMRRRQQPRQARRYNARIYGLEKVYPNLPLAAGETALASCSCGYRSQPTPSLRPPHYRRHKRQSELTRGWGRGGSSGAVQNAYAISRDASRKIRALARLLPWGLLAKPGRTWSRAWTAGVGTRGSSVQGSACWWSVYCHTSQQMGLSLIHI